MVRRVRFCSLLAVVLPGVSLAAKTYVTTPEVAWDALLPYVQASIVPELRGAEFHVFVCQDHTDRNVITPFDEALSDFAKVLVIQAMRDDSKVTKGIAAVTDGFRQRIPTLSPDERARYREVFREALLEAPHVMPRIQSLFNVARRAGKLRCWACDRETSFAPLAERVQGHR